jgi:O-antigen ligase
VLAARDPVIASALALAGAILVLAVAGPMPGRVRALLLGVAAIAVVGLVVPRPAPTSSEGSGSPATGGFGVRASIWSRSLAMLADRPWTGVGPGQFEARFPPYRDPKEIELSTHGRAIDAETEVEHPHGLDRAGSSSARSRPRVDRLPRRGRLEVARRVADDRTSSRSP